MTRATITTAAGVTLEGHAMPGTPWFVAKIPHHRAGAAWAVIHTPTALTIRQGIPSMKAAKSLAAAVHAAQPDLPALAALPVGTAPNSYSHPEAKAEAVGILETINAWTREQATR